MFIPLRDANPTRKIPRVTLSLIVINVLLYVAQLISFHIITKIFACYPSGIMGLLHFKIWNIIYLPGLVTHQFLHASLLHLLGNMLFLYIFGDNVEDYLGSKRFLRFYLICGAIAGFSHVFLNPTSNVPMLGASGAISGLLGAYLLLYPKAKITTLVIVFPVEIPAFVFLILYLGSNIAYALASSSPGVAWYAHIGGFVAGFLMVKFAKKWKN